MTSGTAAHGDFGELAAGYALHALEPADEQRFLAHAGQCPRCRQAITDFRQVTEALAGTAPLAEPGPRLAERILAAALSDAGEQDHASSGLRGLAADGDGTRHSPRTAAREDAVTAREDADVMPGDAGTAPDVLPGVMPLRPRGRRWLRPAATAAAAALIAGGGIWAGLAATATSPAPSVASCGHVPGCTEIVLTAVATHREAARLLVDKNIAWMVPAAMKANDTAGQIYVLWQITGSHRPLAIGSFDVRPGAHAPIRVGALAASYPGTLAFAVSLEHGRTIPAGPSRVVALGPAS